MKPGHKDNLIALINKSSPIKQNPKIGKPIKKKLNPSNSLDTSLSRSQDHPCPRHHEKSHLKKRMSATHKESPTLTGASINSLFPRAASYGVACGISITLRGNYSAQTADPERRKTEGCSTTPDPPASPPPPPGWIYKGNTYTPTCSRQS